MTFNAVNGGCCRAQDVMRSLERNCSSGRSFHLRIRASVMRRLSRGHLLQNAIPLEDGDQEPRSKQLGLSTNWPHDERATVRSGMEGGLLVGARGFEPPTSRSRMKKGMDS
jgi:hypothetical protein